MQHFTFTLAKDLGMSHTNMISTMPLSELKHWVAYYKLEDKDYRDRMDLEIQENQSAEEEARRVRAMLLGLGK